ncbi:hypothetical protein [Actinoplanes siamensis]|uniref:Uncharacterized protein n=1 Tax=Actinoplanes siamensis TaxID=1223317 RepID=A0A919TMS1_9ACTN|nr:hypothetical protein [Actinoplanes siamensis]GIF08646.1 hypothetical protein Asi03nite_61840 [Actinoplanes siamensis]
MPNTANLSLPYPSLSSAPNVPQDIQNLAAALDAKVGGVILCTSATRPTGRHGAVIYETDTRTFRLYDGTNWLRLSMVNESTSGRVNEPTDITGISSTSPTAGTPVCGLSFTAPPSGAVYVTVGGRIESSSGGNETRLGFEIRAGNAIGSGTVTLGPDFTRALTVGTAVNTSQPAVLNASLRYPVDLTPGTVYNVRTMHWVTGASNGAVIHRTLIVEPAL